LKKIISGEPFSYLRLITAATDIYNKGQALSQEALTAYMRETKATKRFFKKTVQVSELNSEIRESYFFPADTIEFWFGVESLKGAERVEVFFRTGEVTFKGFEVSTPTVIYEMLNTEGEFFKTLVKGHFHAWLEEAKKSREAEAF
ncbi:MAG: hypothetical protein HZB83_03310, partial [Deltaproteobacteria bacterium]|nr:hypothetical protein [Deltaproteobacteria bacterium]